MSSVAHASLMNDADRVNELRKRFARQPEIFAFAESLSPEEMAALYEDLATFPVHTPQLIASADKIVKLAEEEGGALEIQPLPDVEDVAAMSKDEKDKYRHHGMRMIAEGHVAAIVLGGGQGTRLGSALPKGMYDLGLQSHKTLFQLQAERIVRLKHMVAEATGKRRAEVSLPWYVMLSDATYEPTVRYFEQNNFFGLNRADVFFFNQACLPCLSNDYKVLLDAKHRIARAPDGNGGIYQALEASGALEDMQRRGIEAVHVYCVDNVLIKPADPLFIGLCHRRGVEAGAKVVPKLNPTEPVGILCVRNGKYGAVEYSELPEELAHRRDERTGTLVYNTANIANHYFTLPFLHRAAVWAREAHRFHVARKKIPFVNANGERVVPSANNGIKLEQFIFDALEIAQSFLGVMVPREEDFSPLKNAPGTGIDEPATCVEHLAKMHARSAIRAGAIFDVPLESIGRDGLLFEISPLLSYEGEDLEQLRAHHIKLPAHVDRFE